MTGEIRDLIYQDLAMTIQSEFGQSITVTNPNGSISGNFIGGTDDIGLAIDPLTGQFVTGRKVSIVLRIDELLEKFSALPDKMWRVTFPQFAGKTFFVKDTMPDRSIGVVNIVIGD